MKLKLTRCGGGGGGGGELVRRRVSAFMHKNKLLQKLRRAFVRLIGKIKVSTQGGPTNHGPSTLP